MPRVGMNPARQRRSDYRPARVTVAVLTCIPNFAGYFRHRFDILRLCLGSLLANTPRPFDLLVFDNGSCEPVVAYLKGLRDAGDIQYLILSSQNIGKIGAFQILFRAAPGEIVAYCDDDVFFLPGWLDAHLQILDTYPRVGMVSGVCIRVRFRDQTQSNQEFAARPEVEALRGRFIPEEWEREYVANTGRNWEEYAQDTRTLDDLLLRYRGVEAFAAANHFQFAIPKRVMLEALPGEWGGQLMGQMVELDRTIDGGGYLRLSTRQRFVRMMGNTIDEPIQALAAQIDLPLLTSEAGQGKQKRGRVSLKNVPFLMRLARAVYDRLYWIIHA